MCDSKQTSVSNCFEKFKTEFVILLFQFSSYVAKWQNISKNSGASLQSSISFAIQRYKDIFGVLQGTTTFRSTNDQYDNDSYSEGANREQKHLDLFLLFLKDNRNWCFWEKSMYSQFWPYSERLQDFCY